jgi:hypothetical protein
VFDPRIHAALPCPGQSNAGTRGAAANAGGDSAAAAAELAAIIWHYKDRSRDFAAAVCAALEQKGDRISMSGGTRETREHQKRPRSVPGIARAAAVR